MADSNQKRTEGGTDRQQLDLGLEGIIAAFKTESVKPAEPVQAEPVRNPDSDPSVELDEFERLAASERWDALYRYCEREIAKKGDSNGTDRATLWWIKAQLKQKSVPGLMLSAPLDSISKKISESQNGEWKGNIRSLCSELLIEVGETLYGGSERELGVSFLERSYEIDKSRSEQVSSLLKRSLSNLNGGKKDQKVRDQIAAVAGKISPSVEKSSEAKATVEPAPKAESGPEVLPIPSKSVEVSAEIPSIQPVVAGKKSSSPIAFAGAALLLGLFGFYLWPSSYSDPESASATMLDAEFAELVAPGFVRSKEFSELDAIYYRIAKAGAATAASSASPGSQAPRKKELVNTDSPLEGSDPGVVIGVVSNRPDPQSAYPNTKRPVGDNAFVIPHEESDGTVVDAFPVDRFDSPKYYKIIVRSKVLTRPSYLGLEIATLEREARVEVIGRVGPWLQLRSRKGRPGYILAQDAQETR